MKGEHILVCLSSSFTNPRVIRLASDLAAAPQTEFTALYVEVPERRPMKDSESRRLTENMKLAEHLGARTETVYGSDIASRIAEYARMNAVTKVVIGQSAPSGHFHLSKGLLSDRLVAYLPDIDVVVIPDKGARPLREMPQSTARNSWIKDSLLALGILTGVTLCGMWLQQFNMHEANIITLYILAVLIISVVTSKWIYGVIASGASVIIFNYFFTEPIFSFHAYDPGYMLTFAVMFAAAFIAGLLASRLKDLAEQSAKHAYRMKILLEANQMLQQVHNQQEIMKETAGQLVKLTGRAVIIYPETDAGTPGEPQMYWPTDTPRPAEPGEEDKKATALARETQEKAGAETDRYSGARYQYLAIRTRNGFYGVVGIDLGHDEVSSFAYSICLAILGECALALENEKSIREKEESDLLVKNEKLRSTLLRSISHDLRTPLTSISGNASNLLTNEAEMCEGERHRVYLDIYDDSMWLINMVENLLSITRIEEGRLNIDMKAEVVEDIVREAVQHVDRKISEHHLVLALGDDVQVVKADSRLIMQVIINLVNNAVKYTQKGSQITISSEETGSGMVRISVADDGPGISDEDKKHIFEMFYTAKRKIADDRRSIGLGLALCKSIAEAHGGTICVADNNPRGTVFSFTLPEEKVMLDV